MVLGAIYLCSEFLSSFILFLSNNQQNFAFFLLYFYAIINIGDRLRLLTYNALKYLFFNKLPEADLKILIQPQS